jgi:UDP-N-acetylglucosamine 2-epimerase (non-hydrolysing)
MKVFLVAGARPNFMKIAPLYRIAQRYNQVQCKIVHTEQHYDYEMSEAFFKDLEIPMPDFFLNSGSGSHAVQSSKIMVAFEEVCQKENPDLIIVVGDVNSTLACSIVAKKLLIKVAHVEAGLRSFDMTMPEEINRIVTDALSDYLFVTEESGVKNLFNEGKKKENIHFVGHVMIDNLFFQLKKLKESNQISNHILKIKKEINDYVFLTLHRPSNVDSKIKFEEITDALNCIAKERPIIFPIHPRTRKMLEGFNLLLSEKIMCLPPLSFRESLFL